MMTNGNWPNRVYLSLSPVYRFAVAKAFEKQNEGELICGSPEVGVLIKEALHARGFTEKAIKQKYAEYTAECLQKDRENLFPGGKL